ncbi:LysR family transcriptional regulator [Flavihumibacter sp. UBA7668]|uniref:LysR family transcriptional regulator n=1 Tax=Flavihumibacter sp. UBA7668 TaxID=1946542 RepID=UPI0025C3E547|nr:LysR family transcriptional regulator [Flavihumibacter sp. UBA7668]
MNTTDLKLFEAVALHGNFTKAAEAMFTVQSNVTARIKSLEEEFGAALFIRSSRKVELTSAGETLLKYSRQINNLLEEARSTIGNPDTVKGRLKIGFLETTMALKGPGLVNQLADRFPSIELDLTSAMRDNLITDVLNYKLDAAFVPAPVHMDELQQIHIMDEQLVAVVPAGVRSLETVLKQEQLKVIVFDQGCFFRSRLETWLAGKGISNYHKTAMNSMEGVVNFIEAGIGFSFLPNQIITAFYSKRKIKTFPLPAAIGGIKTILIYRKDNLSSPVLKAFLSLFTDKKKKD